MSQDGSLLKSIVSAIKTMRLDDNQIMSQFNLDYKQLIFCFGSLAMEKRLPAKRMITFVNVFLDDDNIYAAEECMTIIEKHFSELSGVKTLRNRLINAIDKKLFRDKYQRLLQEPSPTLGWFRSTFPSTTLHPEIERMVKTIDIYKATIESHCLSVYNYDKYVKHRLKSIAANNHLVRGLSDRDANRMWHYLMIIALAENRVRKYIVVNMMDAMSCNICVGVACMSFDVMKIRERISKLSSSSKYAANKYFPSLGDVDNMPPDEKMHSLLLKGFYLPPYCDSCRCQILPF